MEKAKIRIRNGRIYTITIQQVTSTHYVGKDKYQRDVMIPISDIDYLYPIEGDRYD